MIGKIDTTEGCPADGNNDKNIKNFVGSNNDEVDHKLDYKEYILTSCNTPACQPSNYQQRFATNSITDTQKRSLAKAPNTVISRRVTSGIVLITAKLNQSDENKFIHYSSGSGTSALNEKNLDIFNNVQKSAENFVPSNVQHDTVDNSDQQQPKTATILVSKSKTKTGLPLLLKKSK